MGHLQGNKGQSWSGGRRIWERARSGPGSRRSALSLKLLSLRQSVTIPRADYKSAFWHRIGDPSFQWVAVCRFTVIFISHVRGPCRLHSTGQGRAGQGIKMITCGIIGE